MDRLPSLSISIPPISHLPPLSAHEVSAILSSYQSLPPQLPIQRQPHTHLSLTQHDNDDDDGRRLPAPSTPPAPSHTPHNSPLLNLAHQLTAQPAANYGADVPLQPSRRPKWALLELERIAKRADMEVFSESDLPTSPAAEDGPDFPDPATPRTPYAHAGGVQAHAQAPAQPAHLHNLLLGAGDFLIDINVAFSSASPSPTLVALLTSHPANAALDRLLARHLAEFFRMLRPGGESADDADRDVDVDVDVVRVQRHLQVLETWLGELKGLQALVKAGEDAGEAEAERARWWTVVGDVASEWDARLQAVCGDGDGDGAAEDRQPEPASVPLDILATLLPVPLPYLRSPSLTFLLYLAPEAYLTLLRATAPAPAPASPPSPPPQPRTHPPLPALRRFLHSPPAALAPSSFPTATLSLRPLPSPSPPATTTPPNPGETPFPTSPNHHWSLAFDPPVWVRSSALHALGLGGQPHLPAECVAAQAADWLAAVLGARPAPAPAPTPTYTWHTRLPSRSSKAYALTFAPSPGSALEGGAQLSRLPVRSAGELSRALDVVQRECWLAGVLRGLEPWAADAQEREGEDGPLTLTVEQLLAGALPASPRIPMTLTLAPYLAPPSPSPYFTLAVLPHLTLSVHPPTPSARATRTRTRIRVERQSVFPPPNSGPEQARDWEARAAEVLRRGGVPFLAEWAWEGEHALVREYPGKALLPELALPAQPQIRVGDLDLDLDLPLDHLGALDALGHHHLAAMGMGMGMGMDLDLDLDRHSLLSGMNGTDDPSEHQQLHQQLDDAALAAGQTLGLGLGLGVGLGLREGGPDGEGSAFEELFGSEGVGSAFDMADMAVGVGVGVGGMPDIEMDMADLGSLHNLGNLHNLDNLDNLGNLGMGIGMGLGGPIAGMQMDDLGGGGGGMDDLGGMGLGGEGELGAAGAGAGDAPAVALAGEGAEEAAGKSGESAPVVPEGA